MGVPSQEDLPEESATACAFYNKARNTEYQDRGSSSFESAWAGLEGSFRELAFFFNPEDPDLILSDLGPSLISVSEDLIPSLASVWTRYIHGAQICTQTHIKSIS